MALAPTMTLCLQVGGSINHSKISLPSLLRWFSCDATLAKLLYNNILSVLTGTEAHGQVSIGITDHQRSNSSEAITDPMYYGDIDMRHHWGPYHTKSFHPHCYATPVAHCYQGNATQTRPAEYGNRYSGSRGVVQTGSANPDGGSRAVAVHTRSANPDGESRAVAVQTRAANPDSGSRAVAVQTTSANPDGRSKAVAVQTRAVNPDGGSRIVAVQTRAANPDGGSRIVAVQTRAANQDGGSWAVPVQTDPGIPDCGSREATVQTGGLYPDVYPDLSRVAGSSKVREKGQPDTQNVS